MATQGIISIVKENKVIFKCVAGCNGMNATKTANELKKLKEPILEQVYDICLKNGFGCKDCLIVQSENTYKGADNEDDFPELYKTKFQDAQFNPRWECGIASHVEVIECVG